MSETSKFVRVRPLDGDGLRRRITEVIARDLPLVELSQAICKLVAEYLCAGSAVLALGEGALVILDNCEHLVAQCARLAEELLSTYPALQILTTSREPLGVDGEVTYRLPVLSLPAEQHRITAEEVLTFDAVRLFLGRAKHAAATFDITDENAARAARICRPLDGVPLALELAAAQLTTFNLDELEQKLDDRLRLLATNDGTAQTRQQTLESLIRWGYELLTHDERRVLTAVSILAGAWPLTAAVAELPQSITGALVRSNALSLYEGCMLFKNRYPKVRAHLRASAALAFPERRTQFTSQAISVIAVPIYFFATYAFTQRDSTSALQLFTFVEAQKCAMMIYNVKSYAEDTERMLSAIQLEIGADSYTKNVAAGNALTISQVESLVYSL